jgi:hypothetical protein
VLKEIQELLRAGDSFTAIEHIQREGTPSEIAARYQTLVKDLYWKAHDLAAVVVIGRAGIFYCLGQLLTAEVPGEPAQKIGDAAKEMAFNLASFCWPGWEEPGINPSDEELAFGRDCARLNLRLAIQLKRPPRGVSMAHWLIGAHALAARDFDLAAKEFERAQEVLPPTDPAANEMEPCNLGYLAVAQLCKNASDSAAQARFEQIIARLRNQQDEAAQEYLSQLIRARRIFVGS